MTPQETYSYREAQRLMAEGAEPARIIDRLIQAVATARAVTFAQLSNR